MVEVNWGTREITVYRTDLTLVSGTLYKLDTEWFRAQLHGLQESETGIVYPSIFRHSTEVTVAGVTYARTIEIINGYTLTFDPDILYSVRLEGSNNNFFDVETGILNQNTTQVIPGNAAGLIVVIQGSGVTEQDKTDIAVKVWNKEMASHTVSGSFGLGVNDIHDAVILASFSVVGTISTVDKFFSNATNTDHYWDRGAVVFTSGQNKGVVRKIQTSLAGTPSFFELRTSLPFAPSENDTFDIIPLRSFRTNTEDVTRIVDNMWDENRTAHTNANSFGLAINDISNDLKRLLGLTHENIHIDNPVYDGDNNLTAARVRIYSNAGSVGTANDIIGTYTISAPSNAPGKFITWSQSRV